ncbi:MAG TPA: hypothetical protein PLM79_00450 [Syntrophobacteraceae bacterium]|nr:hypothetical protein [Syntrophobacteraceae bacterium]
MEDDLVASLTRQVKEEVIENYLNERKLVHLQMEELEQRAEKVRCLAVETGKRLCRVGLLLINPEMLERLRKLLCISPSSYWNACFNSHFPRTVRTIRVRGFTLKARYRKLFLEAFQRFQYWMESYRKEYEDLSLECRAVNCNIQGFQKNFDLLSLLSFLKSLDIQGLERKHFLGENFTPGELAAVERSLCLCPVSFEKMAVPEPLCLPGYQLLEESLIALAHEVYQRFPGQVQRLMH